MERLRLITPLDAEAMERSRRRWNSIAKPLHSLGIFEETIVQIAGITGSENISLDRRCVVDMCADNGVVCEGVTQTDSSVTAAVAREMAEGRSNINCLARCYGADVFAVDIGMRYDADSENIIDRKISCGTGNIAVGPAMTDGQAEKAISVGIDMVRDCVQKGYKIIVTGEMGIGNTTVASAAAAVILGLPVQSVTGRGAGLDSAGLARKISAIERAISVNRPSADKPLELIAKVGGYDIAGMTGLFLGGAIYKVPVVIDGFISAVSAALASLIEPLAKDYAVCSHVSKEPAGQKMLEYLGKKPVITAEMCLGEGTGGVMLLPLLDGALAVYDTAHKFEDISIKRYEEIEC